LKLRTDFSSRLILYLSIADFCLSIICLIFCAYNLHHGHLSPNNNFVCQAQPVITWYFMEVSILWLTCIAINSYKVVFYNVPLTINEEILANFICWGVPMITSLLPLSSNIGETYGQRNGLWCSFSKNNKKFQLLNIALYYFPCLIVILLCYLSILLRIRGLGKNEITNLKNNRIRVLKRLFLFVLSYFIVWTPLTICYIYEASTGKYISFGVEYVADNLLHVQGVLNFILYGITSELVRNIELRFFNKNVTVLDETQISHYSYKFSEPYTCESENLQ